MFRRLFRWFNELYIIEAIALFFTFITVINSFMMVVGWDYPKTGAFAYIHLMMRLAIITVIIGICDYKEVIEWCRSFAGGKQKSIKEKRRHRFFQNVVPSTALAFTGITIFICTGNILLQAWIKPEGGRELYRDLLLLFPITFILISLSSYLHRHKSRKN